MMQELDFFIDNSKKDFGILKKWTNTKVLSREEAIDNLRNLVSYKIAKMLDSDFDRLLELLYRADINETRVKTCFHSAKPSKEVALELADLYISRLIEKFRTRQEYNAKNIIGDWD